MTDNIALHQHLVCFFQDRAGAGKNIKGVQQRYN